MILGLAPMDGITDLPFRTITAEIFEKFWKSDTQLRTRTEFMNADGYLTAPLRVARHVARADTEQTLIAQIYGGNGDSLRQTARDLTEKYPDFAGIELNIGCPSPKVIACGGGSGMMTEKSKTLKIIESLAQILGKKISIKVRAGLTDADKPAQREFLLAATEFCHTISIHGRTMRDGHSGRVDRDFIRDFKQKIGSKSRVIGNGGLTSFDEALAHGRDLDGTMIAQSAIGNPRIFTPHSPTRPEKLDRILRHLRRHCAFFSRRNSLENSREKLSKNPTKDSEIFTANRAILHSHKIQKKSEDDDTILELDGMQRHSVTLPTRKSADENFRRETRQHEPILHALVDFRKHLFQYLRGFPGAKSRKNEIPNQKTYTQLADFLTQKLSTPPKNFS